MTVTEHIRPELNQGFLCWLKFILALILACTVFVLARFVVRDFRRGVVHTQLGAFERDMQSALFWFWTVNYAICLIFAACAAIWFMRASIA
jgi:hypothetical protein